MKMVVAVEEEAPSEGARAAAEARMLDEKDEMGSKTYFSNFEPRTRG